MCLNVYPPTKQLPSNLHLLRNNPAPDPLGPWGTWHLHLWDLVSFLGSRAPRRPCRGVGVIGKKPYSTRSQHSKGCIGEATEVTDYTIYGSTATKRGLVVFAELVPLYRLVLPLFLGLGSLASLSVAAVVPGNPLALPGKVAPVHTRQLVTVEDAVGVGIEYFPQAEQVRVGHPPLQARRLGGGSGEGVRRRRGGQTNTSEAYYYQWGSNGHGSEWGSNGHGNVHGNGHGNGRGRGRARRAPRPRRREAPQIVAPCWAPPHPRRCARRARGRRGRTARRCGGARSTVPR